MDISYYNMQGLPPERAATEKSSLACDYELPVWLQENAPHP
jgi:hypothetical protein